MTGIPLLIVFCLAIVLMIVAISKFHIHPFLSLMGTSLVLAVVVGLPLEKIPGIIGSGFSGVFSSIGIVIILGALIGLILEKTGAAIRLADVVIRFVGEKHPQLALMLMGWIVSIPVFCDSGFVILNPIRKALCRKLKGASPAGMVCMRLMYSSRRHPARSLQRALWVWLTIWQASSSRVSSLPYRRWLLLIFSLYISQRRISLSTQMRRSLRIRRKAMRSWWPVSGSCRVHSPRSLRSSSLSF